MRYFFANLGVNLVALGATAAAFYLLLHDKEGWGWFLFVALATAGSAVFSDKTKK